MNSTPAAVMPSVPTSLPQKLALLARDIKISHTIFALPFALLSATLAGARIDGGIQFGHLALIITCMVTARTVAMAANRLLDAKLDAQNPRTSRRAIPSGALSAGFVRSTLLLCAAAFVLATAGFWSLYGNQLPLLLSAPVLLFVCAYPLLKRFTALCHFYLGAALALAPVCAWVAIAGRVDVTPLWMAAAVLTWTAGFDIIYACQDYDSDRATGVFSVPSRLGIRGALWVARATHVLSAGMFVTLAVTTPELSTLFTIAAGIAVALLLVEHLLVRADDLSKVGLAFFTVNGIISVIIGTLGIFDVLV